MKDHEKKRLLGRSRTLDRTPKKPRSGVHGSVRLKNPSDWGLLGPLLGLAHPARMFRNTNMPCPGTGTGLARAVCHSPRCGAVRGTVGGRRLVTLNWAVGCRR